MKPEEVDEKIERTCQEILKDLRRILEVPEGESITEHANKIMENKNGK